MSFLKFSIHHQKHSLYRLLKININIFLGSLTHYSINLMILNQMILLDRLSQHYVELIDLETKIAIPQLFDMSCHSQLYSIRNNNHFCGRYKKIVCHLFVALFIGSKDFFVYIFEFKWTNNPISRKIPPNSTVLWV